MLGNIGIILTSVGDQGAATSIATALVEQRLAACVQISAAGESIYRWQGKLEHETEHYLCIKTSRKRVGEAVAWLQSNHPYDEPEIVHLDGEASPGYLAWLQQQTE